ncbi:Flagellar biosynthetic protein FlhF [Candidatus Methylobacter favarea]|uniref:Flagellar biosynthesis protein FlhF n=1 Tax=Candidatus Methylobacter favarea TaxID=2707345 RepID=A0A8S0Y6C1_9GAMM|nr:flagellar biosynthesis protein FlhF [Candidatus Methylobacter favarea]CAA9890983.1 Flagellar biosynthetic protein FlhF [Candidatus Methylobacter favarea]
MKIKRFFAADIRQAMRMVKEELGPDAVIMSNRSVEGGVEIVAAKDFDEQLIHIKLQKQAAEQAQALAKQQLSPVRETEKLELPVFETEKKPVHIVSSQRKQGAEGFLPDRPVRRNIDQYVGYAEKIQLRASPGTTAAKIARPDAFAVKEKLTPEIKTPEKQDNLSHKLLMEMSQELKSLRTAMDSKLSAINWPQSSQTDRVRADLLQRLSAMAISKKLSIKIANRFSNPADPEVAYTKAQEMLAQIMPVAEDDLLDYGGIAALVGPTGVGKTTTIAKLAAKFILKHGPRQVALITTDNYRIGAHEQLNTYGRILDVPVRIASSAEELRNLIDGFADKRLILIDTAGMSQRDMKLMEQINTLQHQDLQIKSYLVMAAATGYKAMNEIIEAFQVFKPQASILTKFDEAATTGSAISSIIEQNLPLAFIADGQQVPEDMHSPCAVSLIERCVAEAKAESDYSDYSDINYGAWAATGHA